jgi:transposase InsO family protein
VNRHKNARLTLHCRKLAIHRIEQEGWLVGKAAAAFGISERTLYRWLYRFRTEGEAGLVDRSSRPSHLWQATPPLVVERIEAQRRQRKTVREIAEVVGVPKSTVARLLAARGLARLSALDPPPPPPVRYEHPYPGAMVHSDTKKLGRIVRPSHRVTGDRRDSVDGAGWEVLHLAIDDYSRLSYTEVLADDGKESTVAFTLRAVAWFADHGITVERWMTDNGPAFRSKLFRDTCAALQLRHVRTRPYRPQTNGKAERFVQTALREWAYKYTYQNSIERRRALPIWQHHYNHHRRHAGIGYLPPISRIRLNNVSGLNS